MTCRLASRVMEEEGILPGSMRTTNMPGAGGGIAYAHAVARRQADSTLLVAASPGTLLRLAQGQYGRLRADQVRWLGAVGVEYGAVAVARDAPWETLDELMRDWRRDPSSLVVSGGSAMAGQDHIKMMLLGRSAGMDPLSVRYVSFDGGGEAITALLGGFVLVFSGEPSELEGHLEAGSIRVLAVLSDRRLEGPFADVPTAAEEGYPVVWATWRGFLAPGGISESAYESWVDRLRALGASPAWASARTRARVRPYLVVGAEFERAVAAQLAEFEALSREIGLLE
jgi:putative tricarboxylic transport membrane protein